jgi:hypothetical protein
MVAPKAFINSLIEGLNMALVGKSKQLVDDLTSNIDRMRRAEQSSQELKTTTVRLNVTEHPWLSELLWGPLHGTEYAGHPALTQDQSVSMSVQIADRDGHARESPRNTYNNYDMTVAVEGAPRWHDRILGAPQYLQVLRAHHPHFQAFADWRKLSIETDARWHLIKSEVLAFVDTCKSLNEAVKLWPDIKRYVSQDYVDRLDRVVDKVKSDKGAAALAKLKLMDLDRIAASTVVARLATAGSS